MPETLSQSQIDFYRECGYLVIEGRIPFDAIAAIRSEIDRFQDMARNMTESDERIDLEDSRSPGSPRIRRVKLPHTQSEVIDGLMRSDHVLAPVRDLIGSDLRLQTTKLNMKSAGFGAAVEWHQDWAFYPYTNDDVLAVGVMIDDMDIENGPLMVFPGTHRGAVHDHHNNGVFAALDLDACGEMSDAVPCRSRFIRFTCSHVHGSALNTSTKDRRIIFYEIMAADAFPIVGGRGIWDGIEEFDARLLCGSPTLEPRVVPCPIRIAFPDPPTQGSIYEVQKAMGRRSFEVVP